MSVFASTIQISPQFFQEEFQLWQCSFLAQITDLIWKNRGYGFGRISHFGLAGALALQPQEASVFLVPTTTEQSWSGNQFYPLCKAEARKHVQGHSPLVALTPLPAGITFSMQACASASSPQDSNGCCLFIMCLLVLQVTWPQEKQLHRHLYICVCTHTHTHTLFCRKHFVVTINLYHTVLSQLDAKVAVHPGFVYFLPTLPILPLIVGQIKFKSFLTVSFSFWAEIQEFAYSGQGLHRYTAPMVSVLTVSKDGLGYFPFSKL